MVLCRNLVEGRPYKYGFRSTPNNDNFRWDDGSVGTWFPFAQFTGSRFKRDLREQENEVNNQENEVNNREKRNVFSPYTKYPSAPSTIILYDLGAGVPTITDHFYHLNPSGKTPVGPGNWVLAPDGTFPALIVCEATKGKEVTFHFKYFLDCIPSLLHHQLHFC